MSVLAVAVSRISFLRRLMGAPVQPLTLAPMLVVIVLFKLAISDGGRHVPAMVFAQVAVYLATAGLLLVGALRRTAVGTAMAAMAGVAAATALWSVRPEATVRQVLLWLLYLSIVAITASALRSRRAVQWFADSVVVTAGWLCLVALFMFWGAGNPGMRWYSTFYWPNPFAAFLLLALPIEVFRYLHAPAREAVAHGSLSVLLAAALILTYSRGAWLSLLPVVPIAAVVLRPPSWPRALMRGLILAAAVAVVVVILTRGAAPLPGQEVLDRAASVSDAGDQSIQGRLNFWRAAWAIFLDHPLGTGAGTFLAVHAAYQRDVRFYSADAHNLYLQTAAEMGVPGLIALAAVLGSMVLQWRRTLRAAQGTALYPLVAGAGIALLAFFVHSGMEMNWMFPADPAAAFVLFGMLAGAEHVMGTGSRRPAAWFGWRLGGAAALCLAGVVSVMVWAGQQEFVRGQALARSGDWSAASDAYHHAEQWNPLQPHYYAARAAALMQLDPPQSHAAEAALRQAMAVDRMNASHPYQLALLFTRADAPRYDEAEALLQRDIRLDPMNRPEVYRALARLYLQQGRMVDAERVYREAIPRYVRRDLAKGSVIYLLLWPEVVGLFMDAAEASVQQGNTIRAAQTLEALLAEDPDVVPAVVRLSEIYITMDHRNQARDLLQATAARMPDDPRIVAALKQAR